MKGSISKRCERQVKKAAKYIEGDSPKEANILIDTFNERALYVCKNPEIGKPYKNEMRKIKLGKFRYNLFYKIRKNDIYFLEIHHTSRGTEFNPWG